MGSESAPLLTLSGVSYAYPGGSRLSERIPALRGNAVDDVTVSVKAGERIALLGGNGAGKSTFLQLCNGLLEPTRGEVLWCGDRVDRSRRGLAVWRMRAGLLFQDPDDQLFAGTLLADASFGPLNQGLSEETVRERALEALAQVGLETFADLPPHVLSHGMRKRAALAGVLAMRPPLLLLDEPSAGLDRRSEEELLELLARLSQGGTAVVLSTHDLELAGDWSDRSLVLTEGRLAYDGRTAALMEDGERLVECGLRRRRGHGL